MAGRRMRVIGAVGALVITLGGCAGGGMSALLVGRVDERECSLNDAMLAEQDPGARKALEEQLKRALEARLSGPKPMQVEAGGGGGGY